jgi:hypothetical protein
LDLLQVVLAVTPPGVDFGLVGVNRNLGFMRMPMNRKALFFPPADGALAALKVAGNFFPRVQAIFGRRSPGVILLGRFVRHGVFRV